VAITLGVTWCQNSVDVGGWVYVGMWVCVYVCICMCGGGGVGRGCVSEEGIRVDMAEVHTYGTGG
jgi:hypothetical protein